jgi:hypothetical protein
VAKEGQNAGPTATLSARERLDLNVSTTFIELALNLASTISAQGESLLTRDRGSVAPYQICNRTGSPINVWSDADAGNDAKDLETVKIEDGQTIDWRFDDWKAMREVRQTSLSITETYSRNQLNSISPLPRRMRLGFNSLVKHGIDYAPSLLIEKANLYSHCAHAWRSTSIASCVMLRLSMVSKSSLFVQRTKSTTKLCIPLR